MPSPKSSIDILKAGLDMPGDQRHGMHSLRSTLVGNMLEIKSPLPIISEALGHQSVNTTSIYLFMSRMRESFIALLFCLVLSGISASLWDFYFITAVKATLPYVLFITAVLILITSILVQNLWKDPEDILIEYREICSQYCSWRTVSNGHFPFYYVIVRSSIWLKSGSNILRKLIVLDYDYLVLFAYKV